MPIIAFSDEYVHPLPEGHKFPMIKYSLLKDQLCHHGIAMEEDFFQCGPARDEVVLRIHDTDYFSNLCRLNLSLRAQRISGFLHNRALIERELKIIEGTRWCAEKALVSGVALNIAGGTHHAFRGRGEGFCLLNDQAVAAQWLLDHTDMEEILIIDLDVHQGNGTAEIFRENAHVFTFSMHGKNNYPLKKEKSDKDVELNDGTTDKEYLYELQRSLDEILSEFTPDFVFYQCGVDVLESDKLGRLSLSKNGCLRRDEIVIRTVNELQVPLVCTMGGGYSPEIKDIVDAHSNTFNVVFSTFN